MKKSWKFLRSDPRRTVYRPGAPGGIGIDMRLTTWVKRLLIANAVVYLVMALGILPPGWTIRALGFAVPGLLRHPWSPLTYMFVHGGFWHLFFNMVAVFFFGPPLEREWGSSFFIKYYLAAGLGGALFSLLLYPMIGPSVVIGASGAVFGLLLAFALNWPNAPIYIWGILPVPAKWFVSVLGALAFISTLSGGGGGVAHWAHLGGLATGFVYLRFGERVKHRLERLLWKSKQGPVKIQEARGTRSAEERSASGRSRRRRRAEGDSLDEIDRILDKIRENGMDSLTSEERSFLDEMSRRYRKESKRTFH